MTTENLEKTLRALRRIQPFRPFNIEFHSGDRLEVPHPEAVRRNGDLFVFHGPDFSHRIFDASAISQVLDLPSPPVPLE